MLESTFIDKSEIWGYDLCVQLLYCYIN